MNPRRLPTRPGDRAEALGRREIAERYLQVAELTASEPGAGVNVCVGTAVLAGIAASDAICLSALGERYSGHDHHAAADLLSRVDSTLGDSLRDLVGLKSASHYGQSLLKARDRERAIRAASVLVAEARRRTT